MVAFLKKFEIVNGKSCLENLMSRFIPMTPVSSARPLMVGDQRNDSAVSGKEIINRSGSISFEAMRANGILVDSGLTDAQLRKFGIDESSNGEGLDQGAKDLAACRPKFPACKNDINQIIHSKTSSLQFLEAAAFDRRASRIRRRDLVHPHIVDRHDLALLIDRVFLVIILAVFSLLPVALFKLSA